MIGLAAPKDVQDAILADSTRAAVVNVVDIRYWWYQPNGTLYAPPGGKNLAPRQWQRESNPKPPTFEQALRAVREYRSKLPDKVIIMAPEDGGPMPGWAVLMGGGSMPNLRGLDPALLKAIPTMRPIDLPRAGAAQYAIGKAGGDYLVYCPSGGSPQIDSASDDQYTPHWINPQTNRISDTAISAPYVLWLKHQ
jgi:hypothetical protein